MKNKIISIISFLLILGIIGAIVGVAWVLTNGFTDDFKTFYVEYEGRVLATTEALEVSRGQSISLTVKYIFNSSQEQQRDFGVKFVSCSEKETIFEYQVQEKSYAFRSDTDMTDGFQLERSEKGFIFTAPYTMREVLERYYGGTVESKGLPSLSDSVYFKLLVSSYNGKAVITLPLQFKGPGVGDIELDTSGIVFGGGAA